ncbi:MAG: KilA-N domain-containing protein [Christensenellaceae bacterium]|nr:KilA-N domain-containing protein [Christensenellaceae bacterium]
MTDREKAELYWAYAISYEKVAKRLVEKGIASQDDVNETLELMYDNLHTKDVQELQASPACQEIIYAYLKKRFPSNRRVSLTDIAREINKESPSYVIQGWLRSRNTIEFLRIWESKHNSDFDESECNALLETMKTPSFTVTPKQWIVRTKAIGLVSIQGKNGGTFAHPDIAADFHMWVKPGLRLALIEWVRENAGEKGDCMNL